MKTLKTLSAALSIIALAALGSPAIAASPIGADGSIKAQLDGAITHAKLDVRSQRVVFNSQGRKDMVTFAKNSAASVVDTYMSAYRSKKALAGGARIIGYAHLVQTDSWTFTLSKGDSHYVIEVAADGAGSRVALWGAAFAARPSAQPQRLAPTPHLRSSRNVRVRAAR